MRKLNVALITALILLGTLLGLVGCSNPEAAVIGDWKDSGSGSKSEVTSFKADHTVVAGGAQGMTGTWSLAAKTVTLKVATIGGKPVADFKKQMEPLMSAFAKTPDAKKKAEDFMNQLDTGLPLTLSDDGKTLSGNFGGTPQTWTKTDAKS